MIKGVGRIERIDAGGLLHDQEESTAGEAVAGMIRHGFGCSPRPLAFTPQFFANTPLDRWFREGGRAEMGHRLQFGRTRDEVHAYGGDLWCSELALAVCAQDGLDAGFNHLDTPSFSLTGDSVPARDEHALAITPGYSQDHRPDLHQAVLERRGSQDGGVPVMRHSWDGHAADTPLVQERAQALRATWREAPRPRYLGADAKLDTEEHAPNLATLGFLPRIPGTLTLVTQVITPARQGDPWQSRKARTRDQRLALCPYGMAQRWLVVWSQAALEGAEARVHNAWPREAEAIPQPLVHLHATRFETPPQAHEAFSALAQTWRDHQVESAALLDHTRSGKNGRPTAAPPSRAIEWPRQAQVRLDAKRIAAATHHTACCVLGTTIDTEPLRDAEVIASDNAQSQAPGGFRFLHDPWVFVASLLVTKPCRMQGLVRVMTLALLVYALAQRRRRREVARQTETIPPHITPPTSRPTLRWVFQVLDGLERVRVTVDGQVRDLRTG